MKNDIIKFRKCVEILKKEKGYTNGRVCDEMGISGPTFHKLMTDDISEFKCRPSILGLVQDFNKKHCNDLNYAGIEPAPEAVVKMKKNLVNYKEPEKTIVNNHKLPGKSMTTDKITGKQLADTLDKMGLTSEQKRGPAFLVNNELGTIQVVNDLVSVISDAASKLPSNVKINISING
jgi:hypothetical protein